MSRDEPRWPEVRSLAFSPRWATCRGYTRRAPANYSLVTSQVVDDWLLLGCTRRLGSSPASASASRQRWRHCACCGVRGAAPREGGRSSPATKAGGRRWPRCGEVASPSRTAAARSRATLCFRRWFGDHSHALRTAQSQLTARLDAPDVRRAWRDDALGACRSARSAVIKASR